MSARRLHLALGAALVLLIAAALLPSSCGRGGASAPVPTRWLGSEDEVALEPVAAFDDDGRLWTVWIAWRDGARPRLVARCVRPGEPDAELGPLAWPEEHDDVALPSLAPWRDGVYCAWEARGEQGTPALFGRALRVGAGGALEAGPLERIADAGLAPQLARTAPERLEIAWQSGGARDYDLAHARRDASGWSAPAPLADGPEDAWAPRVAAAPDGALHVVYDAFDGTGFDVHHLRVEDGAVRERNAIGARAGYQGFPDVSVDERGRAWIVYEQAPQFGEVGGLREERRLAIACVAQGAVRYAPLQTLLADVPQALERADLPRVLATEDGLVLTWRARGPKYTPLRSDRWAFYTTFVTAARTFDGPLWSDAILWDAEGGNEATETLLAGPDGRAWCVFASDARSAAHEGKNSYHVPLEERWRVAVAELPRPTGWPALADEPPDAGRTTPEQPTAAQALDGPADVLFGDLHRHTNRSRCAGLTDGIVLDAFRYARGPGALDFISVTDHHQHLQPWAWWLIQRDTDRYLAPPRLVTLPGLERNIPGRGHMNLIFRDRSVAELDPPEFAERIADGRAAGDVVAIPHMSASTSNPFDWDDLVGGVHTLIEIYQGKRGSYEGVGLPLEGEDCTVAESSVAAAFAARRPIGLIAASDHDSSGDSFAGAYATERSRAAIFAALARSATFATTRRARVALQRSADRSGLVVRVEGEPGRDPAIAYVELVRDGETVARRDGVGEGAAPELFVLTYRHRPGGAAREALVRVVGARILAARPRREVATGAAVSLTDSATAHIELGVGPASVTLELAIDAQDATIEIDSHEGRASGPLGTIEVGRSLRLEGLRDRAALWRVGTPLGSVSAELVFDDVALRPRASYYARVAWVDGSIAWVALPPR